MPVFSYRALNAAGKNVRGILDADTAVLARQKLRSEGLHPVEVKIAGDGAEASRRTSSIGKVFTFKKSGRVFTVDMTRQAATLLNAGVPLEASLAAIQEQMEDTEFGRRLALIREEVVRGETLANALNSQRDLFSTEYIHLVKAGEMAGALDRVLSRLADDLERQAERRARVTSALAYPAFMTLVGGGVLVFLMTFIVPMLTGLFDSLDAALPWPTRLLLFISGSLKDYWWLILPAAAVLLYLAAGLLKRDRYYRRLERFVFRLPVIGDLFRKLVLARIFRSLSVMTNGGVALSTALKVTAEGLVRSNYGQALVEAEKMVGEGRSLADGLKGRLFPPVARRMIHVGETSGTLAQMLEKTAEAYERETDRALSTLTSLVEPVIVLLMGMLVGFVVLAVLLPIFDLSGLVR